MLNNSQQNRNLLISLSVLLFYFLWPFLCNYILTKLNLNITLNLILIFVLNLLGMFLVILVYLDDLKCEFYKFIKNFGKLVKKSLKYFLIGLIGYGIFNFLIAFIFESINISNDNVVILENVFSDNKILLIMSTMLYYPIIEELVFKKNLKAIINNKWLFVIISAFANAFFALAFASINNITLIYVIPYTIFYMGLSYSYYTTNNIFVPITYRLIYNLIPNIALVIETFIILMI